MRYESLISTSAGLLGSGGDGGNVDIAAQYIIGIRSENSDITANAFTGSGGNIRITTNGICGLRFRPRLTPLSDITASSELVVDGTFDLDLLSFPAEQGLNQLPGSLVDAESAFERDVCGIQDGKIAGGSSFVITGRGGLPTNPMEPITPLGEVLEWSSWDNDEETERPTSTKPAQPSVVLRDRTPEESDENGHPKEIRPAQGWSIEPDGTITLTAEPTVVATYNIGLDHPSCQALRDREI